MPTKVENRLAQRTGKIFSLKGRASLREMTNVSSNTTGISPAKVKGACAARIGNPALASNKLGKLTTSPIEAKNFLFMPRGYSTFPGWLAAISARAAFPTHAFGFEEAIRRRIKFCYLLPAVASHTFPVASGILATDAVAPCFRAGVFLEPQDRLRDGYGYANSFRDDEQLGGELPMRVERLEACGLVARAVQPRTV